MDSRELMNRLATLSSQSNIDCVECCKVFQELIEWTKRDRKGRTVSIEHWGVLLKLGEYGVHLATLESLSNIQNDFLANLLRCMRNFIAGLYDEQSYASLNDVLQFALKILFLKHQSCGNEKDMVLLRCCLQVIGNLVCQNNFLKSAVWTAFKQEKTFRSILLHNDLKVQEYIMMILYNCLTPDHHQYLVCMTEGHEILIALTEALYLNIIDWGILMMESVICDENFMEKCYSALPTKSRLLFLDVIAEHLEKMEHNECILPVSNLKCMKDFFMEYAMDVLKTCESHAGDVKSAEIVKLLSLLCSASVSSHCSFMLKSYQGLLELSIDILKAVHLLGKHNKNAFSAISCLKECDIMSRKEVEEHPSFGFKKNLIRLIGNMCSNCKENQDLVRKSDGIPLLLDCCNVDARNPYIMQWGILAIYNVLENNSDNQAVLASISVNEELVNSALLQELGLSVEIRDGRPILKNIKCSNACS